MIGNDAGALAEKSLIGGMCVCTLRRDAPRFAYLTGRSPAMAALNG